MFEDRSDAGRTLGRIVSSRVHVSPLVVLALPRGGVPVGLEVVRCLPSAVAFDVFLVRKLGVPHHEELAFGAIATGGVRVLNRPVIEDAGLSAGEMERVVQQEQIELERREHLYRQGHPPVALRDRMVILVDDGLATGATMVAAVRAARLQQPGRIVVAVPISSRSASAELQVLADDVICARTPEPFFAVGYWYRDFDQVTDDEVRWSLRQFTPATPPPANTLAGSR